MGNDKLRKGGGFEPTIGNQNFMLSLFIPDLTIPVFKVYCNVNIEGWDSIYTVPSLCSNKRL